MRDYNPKYEPDIEGDIVNKINELLLAAEENKILDEVLDDLKLRQIANIKYLDRGELEKILSDFIERKLDLNQQGIKIQDYILKEAELFNTTIDAICNLAIPKDRDKLYAIIIKNSTLEAENKRIFNQDQCEKIINEIIGE